jgi:hypothetical protein
MNTLSICHRCPKVQARCQGACLCTVSGLDIVDHAASGQCPAGYFGHLTASQFAQGVAGIAKALTGTGGASNELVVERTAICRDCPEAELVAGAFHRCRICKCATWAKIRNATEQCPASHW